MFEQRICISDQNSIRRRIKRPREENFVGMVVSPSASEGTVPFELYIVGPAYFCVCANSCALGVKLMNSAGVDKDLRLCMYERR